MQPALETAETLIPVLPCISLDETLKFYRALGFEVIREQTKPYVWGEVRRANVRIDFQRIKGLEPEECYTLTILMVEEVEELHRRLFAALKTVYGKVPLTGFPHISRPRPEHTRIMAIDPAGNSLLFIRRDEPDADYDVDEGAYAELSPLAQALDTAVWLRDLKGHDDLGAAKVLDVALRKYDHSPPLDYARVLAARAELAVALGEAERLREVRDLLRQVPLTDLEREQYRGELEAADALERLLA